MIALRKICLFLMLTVLLTVGVGNVAAAPQVKGSVGEVKLVGDPYNETDFGRSVALEGDLVAVGVGADGDNGAVYLYKRNGQNYILEAKLECPDDPTGAEFGRSVAIKGNMVIVGARFAQVADTDNDGDIDEQDADAGAVYIFKKYGSKWHMEQKIIPPYPQPKSNFGRALAVQGDILIVTARKYDSDSENDGTAYAYIFRHGLWTYQTEIVPDFEPADEAYFGQSVALQGNLMAIGARNDNPNKAGSLYVFRQTSTGWNQIARLTPKDGEKNDQYGFSVAIAGNTIAVGARRADLDKGTKLETDEGAAYVYSVKGNIVELVTMLTASDAKAGDEFGQSIAMAGDVIAVGAPKTDIDQNADQGAVYLFRRMGNRWIEVNKVTSSDGAAGDGFGYSLAAFGNHMVSGAHFADVNGSQQAGAAYVIPLKP
ncbi:MAG: hypothetical protein ABFD66_14035 [Smithella sp.]